MGTNWLEAAEALSEWKVSKINLVAAVRAGKLIAYDYQTFEPVDWEALKKQFNEIKEMIDRPINKTKTIITPRPLDIGTRLAIATSGATGPPPITREESYPVAPIIVYRDELPDGQGNIIKIPRLSWIVLHYELTSENRPTIPRSQYNEILEGWGSEQIKEVVLQSIFREEDIASLFEPLPAMVHAAKTIPGGQPEQQQPTEHRQAKERPRLEDWNEIEKAMGMTQKTIRKADKLLRMPSVIHYEGNKTWMYEDDAQILKTRYGKYKEEKAKEN